MSSLPARAEAPPRRLDLRAAHRLFVVTLLGFASGLPLALTGQAMQAWLSMDGLDVATIGFLSLVGLPYTFKFLWAPLMDRFDLPWLGRRRGWLVLTQLALAGGAAAAGRHVADAGDARVRAAGGGGGVRFGIAGRRDRCLSDRPAARARARHGRVAVGARLPAGDGAVGRRGADLDRPGARQRLGLAAGVPLHGAADAGRRRAQRLCAAEAARMWKRRAAWRATTSSASSRCWPRSASASPSRTASARRLPVCCCRRCSTRPRSLRRCA